MDKKSNNKSVQIPEFIATSKDTFFSIVKPFLEGQPEYFEDIDQVQLSGRYKLSKLKYPCIEIRRTDNKRAVTYHYDSNSFNTYVYEKHKQFWLAKYFSGGDTSDFYTYEYILPGETVSFNYTNKDRTWFHDMEVEGVTSHTYYVPEKSFSLSPELSNVSVMKKAYDYKHEIILYEENNLVKLQTLRTTKEGVEEIRFSECYQKPHKTFSFRWWNTFSWKYKDLCSK